MFEWLIVFRMPTSRKLCAGIPSSSLSIFNSFIATSFSFDVSIALYTIPYDPSPIFLIFLYLPTVGFSSIFILSVIPLSSA